jgi:hypothetical protein
MDGGEKGRAWILQTRHFFHNQRGLFILASRLLTLRRAQQQTLAWGKINTPGGLRVAAQKPLTTHISYL